MELNNLVSIVTPSYNSSHFISETIKSVLSQTYQNWEMIIIDDCSSDNSNEIIEQFIQKDNRIKLILLEKNSGPANARNVGIEYAIGQYIAFLDSDDIWLPFKLEKQIDFMQTNHLSLTFSSYAIIDCKNSLIGQVDAPAELTFDGELKGNSIGNLTAIYDQIKLGKRKFKCIGHEDYLFWLMIMQDIYETKGMIETLAKYRFVNRSISSNKIRAAAWTWSIYYKELKLGFIQSTYYFICYCLKSLHKYKKLVGK